MRIRNWGIRSSADCAAPVEERRDSAGVWASVAMVARSSLGCCHRPVAERVDKIKREVNIRPCAVVRGDYAKFKRRRGGSGREHIFSVGECVSSRATDSQ